MLRQEFLGVHDGYGTMTTSMTAGELTFAEQNSRHFIKFSNVQIVRGFIFYTPPAKNAQCYDLRRLV